MVLAHANQSAAAPAFLTLPTQQTTTKRQGAFVVSNDLFRDHAGNDPSIRRFLQEGPQASTSTAAPVPGRIPYTFVGRGRFVPSPGHPYIETLPRRVQQQQMQQQATAAAGEAQEQVRRLQAQMMAAGAQGQGQGPLPSYYFPGAAAGSAAAGVPYQGYAPPPPPPPGPPHV